MSQTTTSDNAILRQFHYYFSDSNLRTDSHMKDLMEKEEGFIPLKHFLEDFARVKAMNITEERLREVLSKSTRLELNEAKDKVRRAGAYNVDYDKSLRTLYIKYFPKDSKVDDILDFIQEKFSAEPVRLYMRYIASKDSTPSKQFKGSFLVEFHTEEEANKVWSAFGSQTEEPADKEPSSQLKEMLFADFSKLTLEDLKGKLIVLQNKDWDGFKAKDSAKKTASEEESKQKEWVAGLILKIEEIPVSETDSVTRESLRTIFEKFGQIKFVDMSIGNSTAYIRYSIDAVDAAKKALDTFATEPLKLNDVQVKVSILEGEEEEKYYDDFIEKGKKTRQNGPRKGGQRGRYGNKKINRH